MDLKQRVKNIEAKRKGSPPTKAQAARQLDELLASHGLTRESATAQYGSVGAFCYALLLQSAEKPHPIYTDGLTAQERYLQMLRRD